MGCMGTEFADVAFVQCCAVDRNDNGWHPAFHHHSTLASVFGGVSVTALVVHAYVHRLDMAYSSMLLHTEQPFAQDITLNRQEICRRAA